MDTIRAYLLTVVSASIICALVIEIIGKKSPYIAAIKLLLGLFLSITVISPLVKINFNDITSYFEDFHIAATTVTDDGENTADTAMMALIKENTEAYILEKATALGASLDVDVTVSIFESPIPTAVIIKGAISPYAKKELQNIIEKDLAIPRENQLWI